MVCNMDFLKHYYCQIKAMQFKLGFYVPYICSNKQPKFKPESYNVQNT